MNDTNISTLADFLDLNELSEEERNELIQDVGDLVMKEVFRKAWIDLDSVKRDKLARLLEESDANPDNAEKQQAVFAFLDENVERVREYAKKEAERIEQAYRESRDALEDMSG